MKLLLDMDGVLTDMLKPIQDLYDLGPWPPGSGHEIQQVYPQLQDMSASKFWQSFDNEDFWANLPWHDDGKIILNLCEKHFPKINLCTSPTLNPHCASGKVRWIQENLPAYRRKYFIGPKKWHLASPDHCLIDDREINVEKFRAAGGTAILVPRPWNPLHDEHTVEYLRYEMEQISKRSL